MAAVENGDLQDHGRGSPLAGLNIAKGRILIPCAPRTCIQNLPIAAIGRLK